MPQRVEIRALSEPTCSFCAIGGRTLSRAIETVRKEGLDLDIHIHYEPFQLCADLPIGRAINGREYSRKKRGVDEATLDEQFQKQTALGQKYGFEFRWNGPLQDTRDLHRLIEHIYQTRGEAAHLKAVERLFIAFLEENQNIADAQVLARIGSELSLGSEEDLLAFLHSEEGLNDYLRSLRLAIMTGVEGVPVYIVNDEIKLDGMQETSDWLRLFRNMASVTEKGKAVESANVESGQQCTSDGVCA